MTCTCNAIYCVPGLGHEKGCGETECGMCGMYGHRADRCPDFTKPHCCGADTRCVNCPTTTPTDQESRMTKRTNKGHPLRVSRQEAAVKRGALRDQRDHVEQVRELDKRLGLGVGALHERARLRAAIRAEL